jgi:hypothetical protein
MLRTAGVAKTRFYRLFDFVIIEAGVLTEAIPGRGNQ